MKKYLGLGVLLMGSILGQAQDLRLSWRGEQLTRLGLQASLEMPYGAPDATLTSFWGPRLATYYHAQNHLAVMPGLEHGWRYTHASGFFAGIHLHFSLYRSFYQGQTYRLLANGDFKKVVLGGQWGWAPGIDLQVGYVVHPRLQLLAGALYYQQRPYNHHFRHGWAVEAGIRTPLKP